MPEKVTGREGGANRGKGTGRTVAGVKLWVVCSRLDPPKVAQVVLGGGGCQWLLPGRAQGVTVCGVVVGRAQAMDDGTMCQGRFLAMRAWYEMIVLGLMMVLRSEIER